MICDWPKFLCINSCGDNDHIRVPLRKDISKVLVAADNKRACGCNISGSLSVTVQSSPIRAFPDEEYREAGAEVVGATFRNYCFQEAGSLPEKACCSVEAVDDARRVCLELGLDHVMVDETERFGREVMEHFEAEYRRGRTPNPCLRCNTAVRFPRLLEEAERLGFDFVATGHYVRLVEEGGRRFLARGRDVGKDQSYFLAGVDPDIYGRLLFPCGEYEKAEIRALAAEAGLHVASKPESQDVCFLSGRSLEDYLGGRGALHPGEVVGPCGEVRGQHSGVELFTVGQRQGLGVALGRPVYVTRVDPESGRVYLGEEADLLAREIVADEAWLIGEPQTGKIRYRSAARPVDSAVLEDGLLRVRFAEPVKAAAPGQSLVLYAGDRVVGHGVIREARP